MAGGSQRDQANPPTDNTVDAWALYDAANGGISDAGGLIANVMIFDDEDWSTVHLDDRYSVD